MFEVLGKSLTQSYETLRKLGKKKREARCKQKENRPYGMLGGFKYVTIESKRKVDEESGRKVSEMYRANKRLYWKEVQKGKRSRLEQQI